MSDTPSFEQEILDFLEANPAFLDGHPDILQKLHLTHEAGAGTVSLIERQNSSLRQKLDDTRKQLESLIKVARENDILNRRLHELTLTLIEAGSLDTLLDTLLDDLREQFQADAVEVKLFSASELEQAVNESKPGPVLFEDFMQNGKPRCGLLKSEQMQYLFSENAQETGSVAIIPLRHANTEGILAIGSHDNQRFHPGKDTELLQRLGELASYAISRFQQSDDR
ncbi:hypothetical protein BOW28_00045 [Solemya velum gill symbiont]|uniref:DUF484 family protein n=1 Tax=Solemya velum gill symbiont TaxID=2340 RepID=UPI0009961203|nr:DUF484 family protein [Solemya velum gill symbiont]OOZ18858.1 hypothetical protein BOW28_00045 [Solemya velum gill symbiont]OOZ28354.1 hypothetical protein BOW32_00050 [Solemya velum gill symbiont]